MRFPTSSSFGNFAKSTGEHMLVWGGQEGYFLEMSKKRRRVGDLEDIPDILWPVS